MIAKAYFSISFFLCLLIIINGQFNKNDFEKLQLLECIQPSVILHVFSGTENPIWNINPEQLNRIKKIANESFYQNDRSSLSRPTNRVVGYHGFTIRCSSNDYVFIHGLSTVEFVLLFDGRSTLSKTIIEHVEEHLGEVMSGLTDEQSTNAQCDKVPIRGPDTVPSYDPKTDDDGCFIQKQSENNCYAYGTDIVTNSFPQPGRGSGKKWSFNTCSDMGNSSVRDGLVYNGTVLPTGAPTQGHFVALLIWPDTNFHWIRMDADGYWSHKPGGTPVRNTDNTGAKITDPSKSDFSPWTQFCAYFVAQPSKLQIN